MAGETPAQGRDLRFLTPGREISGKMGSGNQVADPERPRSRAGEGDMASPERTSPFMKTTYRFRVLPALAALALGCSETKNGGTVAPNTSNGKAPPAETASLALIADLNKAADILHVVGDEESAKEAEPRLKAVAQRLEKTMKRFQQFRPAPGEEARLKTKYWDALQKASRRLERAAEKVADVPEAQAVLEKSLAEFKKLSEEQEKKR